MSEQATSVETSSEISTLTSLYRGMGVLFDWLCRPGKYYSIDSSSFNQNRQGYLFEILLEESEDPENSENSENYIFYPSYLSSTTTIEFLIRWIDWIQLEAVSDDDSPAWVNWLATLAILWTFASYFVGSFNGAEESLEPDTSKQTVSAILPYLIAEVLISFISATLNTVINKETIGKVFSHYIVSTQKTLIHYNELYEAPGSNRLRLFQAIGIDSLCLLRDLGWLLFVSLISLPATFAQIYSVNIAISSPQFSQRADFLRKSLRLSNEFGRTFKQTFLHINLIWGALIGVSFVGIFPAYLLFSGLNAMMDFFDRPLSSVMDLFAVKIQNLCSMLDMRSQLAYQGLVKILLWSHAFAIAYILNAASIPDIVDAIHHGVGDFFIETPAIRWLTGSWIQYIRQQNSPWILYVLNILPSLLIASLISVGERKILHGIGHLLKAFIAPWQGGYRILYYGVENLLVHAINFSGMFNSYNQIQGVDTPPIIATTLLGIYLINLTGVQPLVAGVMKRCSSLRCCNDANRERRDVELNVGDEFSSYREPPSDDLWQGVDNGNENERKSDAHSTRSSILHFEARSSRRQSIESLGGSRNSFPVHRGSCWQFFTSQIDQLSAVFCCGYRPCRQ